jgi:hypothetical protein
LPPGGKIYAEPNHWQDAELLWKSSKSLEGSPFWRLVTQITGSFDSRTSIQNCDPRDLIARATYQERELSL